MAPQKHLEFSKINHSSRSKETITVKVWKFQVSIKRSNLMLTYYDKIKGKTILFVFNFFEDCKVERKNTGRSGHATFHKRLSKDATEKDTNSTSFGQPNSFPSQGILSKFKSQVLLNPRSKLRLSHDILREKVWNKLAVDFEDWWAMVYIENIKSIHIRNLNNPFAGKGQAVWGGCYYNFDSKESSSIWKFDTLSWYQKGVCYN